MRLVIQFIHLVETAEGAAALNGGKGAWQVKVRRKKRRRENEEEVEEE